jgi:ubiquinone/menaquinone biosynthesis C-methylase UbiE
MVRETSAYGSSREQPVASVKTTGASTQAGRFFWTRGSQEQRVESFYQHGVERYADYHGGMLNFGLWKDGAGDYLTASRNLIRHMALAIGLGPESRLLDVACGMGAQDVVLSEETGCRSITGLDVTWKHVVVARERARQANLEGTVGFQHGTAIALPFPEASFTHVMCIEGGEHFDTREKFLCEAFRVLQPGGRIGLADYTAKRLPRGGLERALAELVRRMWHVPAANVCTSSELAETLERVGFREVRVEGAGEDVIPGYFEEGRKPLNVKRMRAIRGFWVTQASLWIDYFTYRLFRRGLLEYVFAFAEKPAAFQA